MGLTQVAAAVLVLIPSTATVGALLFLPIIVSIVLITWGVGFQGTVWVTSAMLLAVIYLLCWDGDRLWAAASHVIGPSRGPGLLAGATRTEWAGWGLGGLAGMGVFLVTRGFVPGSMTLTLLGVGAVAAVLVVVGWAIALRRDR